MTSETRLPSLTDGSIPNTLLHFALPILYASVLQVFNGSINSLWVGHFLGEAALTATLNANMLIFLLISAAFGFAGACSVLVGQHTGAADNGAAKAVVGTGVSLFSALSFLIAIAGFWYARPLLNLMNTPAEALALAESYMRVVFLAMPCIFMYAFIMSALRGAGDSRTPLHFMMLSVTLDVLLNPVLIFGIGPVPSLGIVGSAVATLLSQAIGLGALVSSLYRRNHPLCLLKADVKLLCIDWSVVSRLVRTGVPMGAEMLVLSLSGVLMMTLVNRFGVNTSAAFGAASQVWAYIQMPGAAMGAAVTSMAAHNVGARKWNRLGQIVRFGILYSVALTGALVLIVGIFNNQVFGLFLPTGSHAREIIGHVDRTITWSLLLVAVYWVLAGVVRAAGAVNAPLVILTVSLLLVRFSFAELLVDRFQADAIWWSFSISSALAVVLAVLHYKFGSWRTVLVGAAGEAVVIGRSSQGTH